MATTFQSAAVTANNAYKSLGVFARTFTYTYTTALIIADVIEMLPVFAGETVLNLEMRVTDIDGGTDSTLDVGDGVDTDRFLLASTVGQAGGLVQANLVLPYQYAADDTLDVKVSAAGTDLGGTITMTAYFQAA